MNKVETKVSVTFDFLGSRVLSWEQKGRIGNNKAVQSRMDSSGYIAVSSQTHRTQALNKKAAVEKLLELLEAALRQPRKRVPTKKTRSSQRKRLEGKRIAGGKKVARRRVSADDE